MDPHLAPPGKPSQAVTIRRLAIPCALMLLACITAACPARQAETGVAAVVGVEDQDIPEPGLEQLLQELDDPDPYQRVEAATGLVQRYPGTASRAVPMLLAVLPDDESHYANCNAALLLSEIVPGSAQAGTAILAHAEESSSWRYQEAAARALRNFNTDAVDKEGLLRILRTTDHPSVLMETGRTLVHFHPEYADETASLTRQMLISEFIRGSAYEDPLRLSLGRYENNTR